MELLTDIDINNERTIIHEGREYIPQPVYARIAGYCPLTLQRARNAGLPHITREAGRMKRYFYNREDCEKWHSGEEV